MSLPAVSARLGHSSPTITSEIYAHVVPGDAVDSARSLEDLAGVKTETAPGKGAEAGRCQLAVEGPSDLEPAVN